MKPGRELDSLVAEKVMGWTEVGSIITGFSEPQLQGVKRAEWADHFGEKPKHVVPNYSTDISAAWEVLRKTETLGFYFILNNREKEIVCELGQYVVTPNGNREVYRAGGDSTPHAICLAALKAIGEKNK